LIPRIMIIPDSMNLNWLDNSGIGDL